MTTDNEYLSSDIQNSEPESYKEIRKPHKCEHPNCKAVFSRPWRLARHVRQHTGERPYKCTHKGCNKDYTNSSHLKRHVKSHSLVKEWFQCPKCLLSLTTQTGLKRHYERAHGEPRGFTCDRCKAHFWNESIFSEHMSTPDCLTGYKCRICNKLCTTITQWKRHQRRHHERKKTYPCTEPGCTEIFNKWTVFCAHKISQHNSEYKCKQCDKVFLRKTDLKSHVVVHATDRPVLPCPYEKCPRFYFFKRNLDNHVRTAHLGKGYYCDMCGRKFSSKVSVSQHITIVHMNKKKKKNVRKLSRRKRKDAGIDRKSALSKLVGLSLPPAIEKDLMSRKTKILDCPVGELSTINDSQSADQTEEDVGVVICNKFLVKSFVALSESETVDVDFSSDLQRSSKQCEASEEICSS